jgi:vacuolar-type H+-ATPase subunit D/Vma8
MSQPDILQMVNTDKMLNDLLDILANLDGRVKRLELKKSIKRRPSYLQVVSDKNEEPISNHLRMEHAQQSLALLSTEASTIKERVDKLEKSDSDD